MLSVKVSQHHYGWIGTINQDLEINATRLEDLSLSCHDNLFKNSNDIRWRYNPRLKTIYIVNLNEIDQKPKESIFWFLVSKKETPTAIKDFFLNWDAAHGVYSCNLGSGL